MSCNTLSAVTTMLTATQPNDTMRILTAIRALASVAVGEMRNASPDFEDTIPPAAPEITHPKSRAHLATIPLGIRLINILFSDDTDASKVQRMEKCCSGSEESKRGTRVCQRCKKMFVMSEEPECCPVCYWKNTIEQDGAVRKRFYVENRLYLHWVRDAERGDAFVCECSSLSMARRIAKLLNEPETGESDT